jgi:3-phenylpropionate/trans-cinnamate dioxygenase ferredoxin subunit
MEGFTEVIGVDELADGAMIEVKAAGETLLLVRAHDAFYASQARCPHLHGRLADGNLTGTIVTCPRHGSQFDVTEGRVIRWTSWVGAAEAIAEALRRPRPLRVYETRVEASRVLIGSEKPAPGAD